MKQKVAYQGIPGAYSHIAAKFLFPKSEFIGFETFEKVFKSLKKGMVDFAVLPFDNTLVGSIYEVYDLLFKYSYKIKGEINLKVEHNLLGSHSIKHIRQVYSHPRALEQCNTFFEKNKKIVQIAFQDTAAAAKFVSQKKDKAKAAIASLHAAKLYNLKVIKNNIQSDNQNFTRFVVVTKRNNVKKGNKTSIIFAAAHRSGSLLKCLKPFSQAQFNLTKIQSRPLIGKPWQFLFYLDFEHPPEPKMVEGVLLKVKPHTQILKKLGTYQTGPTIKEVLKGLTPKTKVL